MLPLSRARHAKRSAKFLLLRFLCRHKENEVAVGQTRRFCFCLWGKNSTKKSNRLRPDVLSSFPTIEAKQNFVSSLKPPNAYAVGAFIILQFFNRPACAL
jgi:hypothetical protein